MFYEVTWLVIFNLAVHLYLAVQNNVFLIFLLLVIPKSTVSSQSVSVKESTSIQSTPHPKFPYTEIFNQSVTEGSDAFLYCEHKGKVVWRKDKDGHRQTILTKEENGEMVKHIGDPHNRYSVLSDLSLHINKVSLSDSGIYYCNNIPVNLIVTASVIPKSTVSSQSVSVKESTSIQSNTHPKFTSTGSIGVIVAVCGVVFVALILLILACIKRKVSHINTNISGFDSLDGPTSKYTHPKFTSTPGEEYSCVVYHRI
ncbi:uncharacterized protein LOC127650537 isoform X6 [Xyrauchen texanus]|uniref:uncharacterized protein LOC127650537 isoform X6 n=1 Tax=Xyrauchen texanus TaxID=154827 RepID=UPI002242663A|nr:uncharacterized protein LOC127650537 isoform X6 [Xyrauchen texanus]